VHCLVYREAVTSDPRHPSKEVLDEACYETAGDGLEARIATGGPGQPVRVLAREAAPTWRRHTPTSWGVRRAARRCTCCSRPATERRASGAAAEGGREAVASQLVRGTALTKGRFDRAVQALYA
jgi:hypothetical protein